MQYLGGKARTGKRIAALIASLRVRGQTYIEPFVGGGNVLVHISNDGPRFASDIDHELISMWQALQRGWVAPWPIDEDNYRTVKNDNQAPPELRAFVKYAVSWGGKPWGGFARGERDFSRTGSDSLARKSLGLGGVQFRCCHYEEWSSAEEAVIYCDPPYAATTGYRIKFDNDRFWSWVRIMSARNTVLVSEYAAPYDFVAVAEYPHTRGLDNVRVMERVFRWSGASNDNKEAA